MVNYKKELYYILSCLLFEGPPKGLSTEWPILTHQSDLGFVIVIYDLLS